MRECDRKLSDKGQSELLENFSEWWFSHRHILKKIKNIGLRSILVPVLSLASPSPISAVQIDSGNSDDVLATTLADEFMICYEGGAICTAGGEKVMPRDKAGRKGTYLEITNFGPDSLIIRMVGFCAAADPNWNSERGTLCEQKYTVWAKVGENGEIEMFEGIGKPRNTSNIGLNPAWQQRA